MIILPAFQLGLFPEVVVIYPFTFCVTLNGSLLRTYTELLAFTISFGKVFCGPSSHQVEEALFWIVLRLAPASFIWWPWVLVPEEGVNKLISVPLSSKQLVVSDTPIVSVLCPIPHVVLFYSRLERQTCSVIACRNCCAHSVILGALLWSFSVSTVPLFFQMKGSELHPVFKVWMERGLSVWYNDFLILCSFPNNPEHMICLFWLLSSIELVFSWTCLSYTEELTFEC